MIVRTVDRPAECESSSIDRTDLAGRDRPVATPESQGRHDGHSVWLQRIPLPLRSPLGAVAWFLNGLIGFAALLVLLTITAAVPVLNLFALGCILESEAQIAKTGKLRMALTLLPAAMRFGSILIGVLVSLAPVMLLAEVATDVRLIAPYGTATWMWIAALVAVSTTMGLHVVLALSRGGSLGSFVRPIKNFCWLLEQLKSGDYWSCADRELASVLRMMQLQHHFWLGFRGLLGTWIWLLLPTALYGLWWQVGSIWFRLPTLVSGVCLVPVLAWAPFLQIRLAIENRWSAMFEVRRIRELFQHAPLSWFAATAALYALSIPLFLYSLKFRMHAPFRLGVWWDLTLVSILCTFPARVTLGWAYHQATVRGPAWIGWIWLSRVLLAGTLALYIWLLFYTPLTHEFPSWQIEHHSLVLPIPW